ncbi:MAG TPA: MBL fold metallo-hydrolase [Ktedonobacterales bacterium]|nr:MBL fold metallo-hydrolase [Ktedonobacterales bacterium]
MQDALPLEAADLELEQHALGAPVEAGVWRVPAPVPFGARTVNLYLISGPAAGHGWLLVDAPIATSRAEAALAGALERIGITAGDISAIVLTHAHPDHLGAAGAWQRRTGAPVYLLANAAHDLAPLWADVENNAFLEAARTLVAHGMSPDEAQALVTRAVQIRGLLDLPAHPQHLAHGRRVQLAGGTYHVEWLPGHADGQLGLLRDDGLLIAGDAVLPSLVPSVGWYPWSRPDPLGDQLATLDLLTGLRGVRLVLPGHGQPFGDLAARAGELRGLYARELSVAAQLLAGAPDGLTAYALAQAQMPQRMHAPDSRLLAMAEAVALLERLVVIGRAERTTGAEGAVRYRRADETAARTPAP